MAECIAAACGVNLKLHAKKRPHFDREAALVYTPAQGIILIRYNLIDTGPGSKRMTATPERYFCTIPQAILPPAFPAGSVT